MADQTVAEQVEQYREIGKQLYGGVLESWMKSDTAAVISAILQDAFGTLLKTGFAGIGPIGEGVMRGIAEAEDGLAPMLARHAANAVNDLFGTNVSEAEFSRFNGGTARTVAGPELGRALMEIMGGGDRGALAPSTAGADKFVGAMAGAAIEDWFKGWFFEVISALIPIGVEKIEKYGALTDKLVNTLGINGVSRRVFRPLVDTTIVTPLEWHLNKIYRPRLLSVSQVARQLARKRLTREEAIEELARQGWSEKRIDALIAEQRKYFSVSDVRTFVSREHWDGVKGLQHLLDQGFDEDSANDALRLEGIRRIEQLEGQEANAIIAAYVDRRIDRATFSGMLNAAVSTGAERALLSELADVRRACNVRRISPSEARAAVKAGILNVRDYRAALEREGYPDEDVLVLELLLRHELDERAKAEELRAAALAERAAERAQRDAEKAARRAEIERERAEARRGPLGPLEQAAIRGLIPIARVEEVYAFDYDGDTVGILVELLEDRRQDYIAAEQGREEAVQRARRRNIAIGDIEQAVLNGVLTLDEYQIRLEQLGFPPADVGILRATLDVRRQAAEEAARARLEAQRRAQIRRIDLARFERLVRRGLRTPAQYTALLEELGFDAGSVAAMVELLEAQIADDEQARRERDAREGELNARGLSLAQMRRAVLLEIRTLEDFQAFLIAENFTSEAQLVLLAELRLDMENARDARERRERPPAPPEPRELPLATVRRAVILGAVSVDTYIARMRRAGYVEDDIGLDVELLLTEIADIRHRQLAREAAENALRNRGLSLEQTARLVRAGLASIDTYRARAIELGYSGIAAEELVDLLTIEVAHERAGLERRDLLAAELAARDVSLEELEARVRSGELTIDAFIDTLRRLGVQPDDAELVAAVLLAQLEEAEDGGSGG
jgi:hypothetical protein